MMGTAERLNVRRNIKIWCQIHRLDILFCKPFLSKFIYICTNIYMCVDLVTYDSNLCVLLIKTLFRFLHKETGVSREIIGRNNTFLYFPQPLSAPQRYGIAEPEGGPAC